MFQGLAETRLAPGDPGRRRGADAGDAGWPPHVRRAVVALPWFVDALVVAAPTGDAVGHRAGVRPRGSRGRHPGGGAARGGQLHACRPCGRTWTERWNQDAGPSWADTSDRGGADRRSGPFRRRDAAGAVRVPENAATLRARAFADDLTGIVASARTLPQGMRPGGRRCTGGVAAAARRGTVEAAAAEGGSGAGRRQRLLRRLAAAAALQDRLDVVAVGPAAPRAGGVGGGLGAGEPCDRAGPGGVGAGQDAGGSRTSTVSGIMRPGVAAADRSRDGGAGPAGPGACSRRTFRSR